MHQNDIRQAGPDVKAGSKVLILLHGRGATAEDILTLADHLHTEGFTLLAPQATNHTWYPYSFMAPSASNEPWLSSALSLLKDLLSGLHEKGIPSHSIYFLGFSQGACLTLEFVARNAARFGGVIAFTGGLVGEELDEQKYSGDFGGSPVFIGTSDPDPHVPVHRVHATSSVLKGMNAAVTVKVYPGMGHTINTDELEQANRLVLNPQIEKE